MRSLASLTLALVLTDTVGLLYALVAAALGAVFVLHALALQRDPTPKRAIRFFAFSNVYLMLVFVAVAVDALVS